MTTLHTQQLNTTSQTHTRRISTPIQIPLERAGITFKVGTLFHIPDSPDPGYMNQQGWLPPCRPDGLRWQGLRIILFLLNHSIIIFSWAATPIQTQNHPL